MVQIETPRLRLCTWDDGDWELLKPIATDPRVMHFISRGVPWSDGQTRHFVDRTMTDFRKKGFCRWKLEEKSTGKMIGFCGLGFLHDEPAPEIGWWIAHDSWGLGYASEAARAAFDDARNRLQLPRIVSIAHRDNEASIRIMKKLGMRLGKEYSYAETPTVMYVYQVGTLAETARV